MVILIIICMFGDVYKFSLSCMRRHRGKEQVNDSPVFKDRYYSFHTEHIAFTKTENKNLTAVCYVSYQLLRRRLNGVKVFHFCIIYILLCLTHFFLCRSCLHHVSKIKIDLNHILFILLLYIVKLKIFSIH